VTKIKNVCLHLCSDVVYVCSRSDSPERGINCDDEKPVGLTRRQRGLLCRRYHRDMINVVRQAATATLAACRHQLNDERWNCPLHSRSVVDHIANAGQ